MKHFTLSTALCLSLLATPLFAQDKPGEGVTVRPIIGNIAEEFLQARIIYRTFSDLGYTLAEPQQVEIQTAHLAVGTGDGDLYIAHWGTLPSACF